MAAPEDSFLPRIQSVFYAAFDVRHGPMVVYQVPEGLIVTGTASTHPSGASSYSSSPVTSTPVTGSSSRASSISIAVVSPSPLRPESRLKSSPPRRSFSTTRTLFNFDDVSKYIIPPSPLCGRLVVCNANQYKIIGFPSELRGDYERNYFRFNVCFVFDRSADISCYEPIVRKVSRVLVSCEEESAFLSSPETSPKIYAILEQLYEDLNSYSETSIPIDAFNSIELKIFPFYPNPPSVRDWMVPLALIDLERVIEPNWDLTMAKVCQYIDGTNHVSRIAHLAHCDLELTHQAIGHLLYYQVIMTIDIFQYSNMYTLRKSIQWLADEDHVKDECGPYTVRDGCSVPDWPKLLHLYSRLKTGKTVFEWMQDHEVKSLGIDARRFTSFGVIKGFLRRVHRWPVLIDDQLPVAAQPTGKASQSPTRRRSMSIPTQPTLEQSPNLRPPNRYTRRPSDPSAPSALAATNVARAVASPSRRRTSTASAAELSLGNQLQFNNYSETVNTSKGAASGPSRVDVSGRGGEVAERQNVRRTSLVGPTGLVRNAEFTPSLEATQTLAPKPMSEVPGTRPLRPRLSRSPSGPAIAAQTMPQVATAGPAYPPELLEYLDGEHHTDELCTRFGVGWPTLEQWLVAAGHGKGDGDLGKVLVIYR